MTHLFIDEILTREWTKLDRSHLSTQRNFVKGFNQIRTYSAHYTQQNKFIVLRRTNIFSLTENNQCGENLFRKVGEPRMLTVKKNTDDSEY